MTAKRSVEARFRKWHISEEATIDILLGRSPPWNPISTIACMTR